MLEAISDSGTASYTQQLHPDDERLARAAAKSRADVVDLIARGDAEGAEHLWRRHLTAADKVLIGGRRRSVVDILDAQAPIPVTGSTNGDERSSDYSPKRGIAPEPTRA